MSYFLAKVFHLALPIFHLVFSKPSIPEHWLALNLRGKKKAWHSMPLKPQFHLFCRPLSWPFQQHKIGKERKDWEDEEILNSKVQYEIIKNCEQVLHNSIKTNWGGHNFYYLKENIDTWIEESTISPKAPFELPKLKKARIFVHNPLHCNSPFH